MKPEEKGGIRLELSRLDAAFMNAPIGMALLGLDGSFARVNPALCELIGYGESELTSLTVEDVAHPDDYQEQVALMRRLLDGEMDSYTIEKRYTRKSGEVIWIMLAVSLIRKDDGQPWYMIGQTANISARKQVEADLRHEAGLDPLTELANRRQFEHALDNQIERARQFGETGSLMVIDLDGFKAVNDRHGHETGDSVLRFFAEKLKGQVRSTDMVARLGGDEFVVLMVGVGPKRSPAVATNLTNFFEKVTFDPDGLALPCRVSVGWASIDQTTESPASVLAEADREMYEAKRVRKAG